MPTMPTMRYNRAETTEFSREIIDSHYVDDDYYDYDYYEEDYDYDYDPSYRSALDPTIHSMDREEIIAVLSRLSVHEKTSTLFEDIVVGTFVIVVQTKPILEHYILGNILTYKTMSLHISEFQFIGSHYSQVEFEIIDDLRFNMKPWINKFQNNVAKDFTFDELVDLIQHCKRIERLYSFF